MDGSPSATPPRGRHEMLDEALDLVDEARVDGVDVRLVGGLAVLALCAGGSRAGASTATSIWWPCGPRAGDFLDTFAPPRLRGEPPRPPGQRRGAPAGLSPVPAPRPPGPLHADDRIDVYLDAFRLHHTIALLGGGCGASPTRCRRPTCCSRSCSARA